MRFRIAWRALAFSPGGALALFLATFFSSHHASAFEHRHHIGVGYQFGQIATKESGSFHFRSFPVSLMGRYGSDWAAEWRLSMLFPLRARQEELTFAPRAEYERTQQYDAFVGPNLRFTELHNWHLASGLGAHMHYVRFQSTEYVEWSSAAAGLGASTSARTRLSEEFWGGHGELAVRGDLSYDFIDLSRGGNMRGGVQGQFLVSVGWAMGGAK